MIKDYTLMDLPFTIAKTLEGFNRYIIDNITSLMPQVQDAKESLLRETAAQSNVIDGEETTLKQVVAYGTGHGSEKFD